MPLNMLLNIKIKNFKSLEDTEINFSKNSFLIGMNGAGKTTVLQAIDFLSAISLGEIAEWLDARGWSKKDLTFYGNRKSLIDIVVTFSLRNQEYIWRIYFNNKSLKCSMETITKQVSKNNFIPIMAVNSRNFTLFEKGKVLKGKINFKYQGSILSALKSDILGDELNSIHKFFNEIRSTELLSPTLMKKRARESKNSIGLGGEMLSAFINSLDKGKREKLQKALKDFFPNIDSFESKSLRSGWKTLSLIEKHNNKPIKTDSLHLSDGILRILAILSQLLTTESVLIFDEIEDGINQEFVEKLVDTLLDSSHQTIVATHSPLLLNYLDDEVAKESILFVYKTKNGATKVGNFFDIIAKYQEISQHEYDLFGAGEIMQRVNLLELTEKLLQEGGCEVC